MHVGLFLPLFVCFVTKCTTFKFVEHNFTVLLPITQATLPPGCTPLEDHPLDTADPIALFGSTDIVGRKASPKRVGNLRQRGPIPTGHFAINEIKAQEPRPMILFPYEGLTII